MPPTLSPRERYDCIVFDLDGTMLDTLNDMTAAVNRLLQRVGRAPVVPTSLVDSAHDGLSAMLRCGLSLTGGVPQPEVLNVWTQEFLADYAQQPAVHTQLYPDLRGLLEELRDQGFRLAVCTNKPELITRRLLNHFGLSSLFQSVVGGDSLPARKPDALPLQWIARQLGTSPKRTLLVGDSSVDAACATAAGSDLILMEHGYGGDQVVADCMRAPDFTALRTYLCLGLDAGRTGAVDEDITTA